MIAEVAANHKIAETFLSLAMTLTGRAEVKRQKRGDFLSPLIAKLRARLG